LGAVSERDVRDSTANLTFYDFFFALDKAGEGQAFVSMRLPVVIVRTSSPSQEEKEQDGETFLHEKHP
jgi:hypothetical protein